MMLIYLIIFITISKCKFQQHSYWYPKDSYNKHFIDSFESDYNLTRDKYRYEVVNNGNLKNPIRIVFIKSDVFPLLTKPFELYKFSKFIGVKYRSNSLVIPRHCTNYKKGSTEICSQMCEPAKCMDYRPPNEWQGQCKYLDSNDKTVIIPAGPGLKNVDLVIFLTAASDCLGDQESYFNVCAQGLKGRPIFGAIKFCMSMLDKISRFNKNRIREIFIHDVLQIMAFDNKIAHSFVKPDGTPYLDKSDPNWRYKSLEDLGIMKRVIRPRESVSMNYTKTFSVFTLKNSVDFVRQHFNCSDLEGIDMIMRFDHQWTFDKLKYGEDIMSSELNPFINDITMLTVVFLEDSGWYYGDRSQVNQFYNGRGLGCTFAKGGCYSYIKDKTGDNLRPYCDIPINVLGRRYVCSGNRKYYLSCDLRETNLKGSKYVYFKNLEGVNSNKVKYYSGTELYNEYCPLYVQFLDHHFNDNFVPAKCIREIDNVQSSHNFITDYVGNDSQCLEYNTQRRGQNYGAACFKISNQNEKFFNFEFNKRTYKCYYNKIVEVEKDGFKYQIDCGNDPLIIPPALSISNINHANGFLILFAISMNINSVF